MIFHMSNHIKFCLKTFIANSRVKQFFSYLSSYMPFHVLLCRAFCNNTVRTQMAQCIFLNRSKQVWFHVGFLFTYVRFYWFFTCVNLRVGVCFQFQCRKKNLVGIICTYVLPRNHCTGNMLGKLHIQTFFLDTSSDTDLPRIQNKECVTKVH